MRILSYSESILLADEMSEFCICAERCEKLLNKLIDDYFSDLEQKKLDAYDAGYIGDILRLLRDDLNRNLFAFACKTGDVERSLRGVKFQAQENRDLLALCDLTVEMEKIRNHIADQRDPHKEAVIKPLLSQPMSDGVLDQMRQIAGQQRGGERL